MNEQDADLITLTADIVGAHVAHNNVATEELAGLIQSVHAALKGLGQAPEPVAEKQEPAVSIRASVKPDHIVCLEDGKKLKMLKRYLRTNYDMSPDEYRRKWNLPSDYPMVAPNYAEKRRSLAHSIGLGRKNVEPAPVAEPAVEEVAEAASAKRGRKPKADDAVAPAGDAAPKRRGRKPKAEAGVPETVEGE
ncbi:MucR family transcriptional regulator [Sphingomonas solaris]|uniref:MucR family transcriptional regulator n=1 Tax=Alterirhizorhabdus solaris TaxID=2529389 RepID=A0A558R6I1_9SPHN|nr:MucR family transcriptional regulator [Sphingomonas solaris]TVV74994.1 MucR family transcriptional regulator [Sphingomonas solaris]